MSATSLLPTQNPLVNYLMADEPRATRRPGLLARIGSAIMWVATMRRRVALISELAALSDRELADIGLTRGDLSSVLNAAFSPQHQDDFSTRNLAR